MNGTALVRAPSSRLAEGIVTHITRTPVDVAQARRLDWVPSVLAGLDRPFVIEEPDELRERVRALAGQLTSWAGAR